MKTYKIILLTTVLALSIDSKAQTLNWSSLKPEERNIVQVNVGFDYAFTYGIGYARQLKTKLPILLNVELLQPSGEEVFDDFKTKLGGQIRVYRINNLQFIAKVQGVFRRYHNDYVRLLNFGSDMSAVVGYYKPKWFVSGEFGFDKAIVTHFKHSDQYRGYFPDVRDGWYQPTTGGNFYFGLQTGLSFKTKDVTIKFGKVVQQNLKTNPTIPFYVQINFVKRF